MVNTTIPGRGDFHYFMAIPTRWMDNDIYGHVNNVTYYSYFDTAVNHHLITAGGLDIHEGSAFGVVAETSCRFLKQLQFPDVVNAGVRITRLGRSSVRYEIGLFRGDDEEPAALGTFVHVWVDRARRRPVPIPGKIRAALAPLAANAS
jgi:acyl-CoA thioester hydrolase